MFDFELNLHTSWKEALKPEFTQSYFQKLCVFLQSEIDKGQTIHPSQDRIFAAFNSTPLEKVRVVIVGQDPYHGENQAQGLSFSVPNDARIPPSLKNIYKELANDLNVPISDSGDLQCWADQGVLLLNAVLTVRDASPNSHQGKGWERFTDAVIELINNKQEHIVFMLWGTYAQKKGQGIDKTKHLILEAPHPSPLSAHRGFLGCQHFSLANDYLIKMGKSPIDWQIDAQTQTSFKY